jgi:hypothetical protein
LAQDVGVELQSEAVVKKTPSFAAITPLREMPVATPAWIVVGEMDEMLATVSAKKIKNIAQSKHKLCL